MVDRLPKFYYATKVKLIIRLIARLINLLQKVLQQTDSSSKEFHQKDIYIALSHTHTRFLYISPHLSSIYFFIYFFIFCHPSHPHSKKKTDLFYDANDYTI